ncbi:site-2 protease family protein [Caviibacter abscessus]|uniref:site-2 protease family protein n=1 Tax=Caviibacter abscessus TaxID=1766719 RepID=UPI000835BF15|nr:site-2 protease family protein [Caviibacter abscessus]
MKIIITVIILGIVILLHELGHFLTAKYFGLNIREFSIGMGPKIWSYGIYKLRLLPLGGYVSIEDEEFDKITNLKKLIILKAGIFMNILTCFICMGLLNISKVFVNFYNLIYLTFKGLILIFSKGASMSDFVGPVGLPILVGNIVNNAGYYKGIIVFTAIISLNLAIMNLLPIPALDGGRILFTLLNMLGLKISKNVEQIVHLIGMIILLIFMIALIYNDIFKYVSGGM